MTQVYTKMPVLSGPFAYKDPWVDYSFYKTGLTSAMTVPAANGGTRFNRHMLNGIGYLATLGTFLWECGFPFSQADMEKAAEFGGYPKGAIVYTINEAGYLVEYVSKIDNNLNPIPEFVGGVPHEDDNWMPLYETTQTISVPDWSAPIAETTITISQSMIEDNSFLVSLDIPQSSMVVVSRKIVNWDNLLKVQLVYGSPLIQITANYPESSSSIELETMPISEGKTSLKYLPTSKCTISVASSNYNHAVYGDIEVEIKAYALGVQGTLASATQP